MLAFLAASAVCAADPELTPETRRNVEQVAETTKTFINDLVNTGQNIGRSLLNSLPRSPSGTPEDAPTAQPPPQQPPPPGQLASDPPSGGGPPLVGGPPPPQGEPPANPPPPSNPPPANPPPPSNPPPSGPPPPVTGDRGPVKNGDAPPTVLALPKNEPDAVKNPEEFYKSFGERLDKEKAAKEDTDERESVHQAPVKEAASEGAKPPPAVTLPTESIVAEKTAVRAADPGRERAEALAQKILSEGRPETPEAREKFAASLRTLLPYLDSQSGAARAVTAALEVPVASPGAPAAAVLSAAPGTAAAVAAAQVSAATVRKLAAVDTLAALDADAEAAPKPKPARLAGALPLVEAPPNSSLSRLEKFLEKMLVSLVGEKTARALAKRSHRRSDNPVARAKDKFSRPTLAAVAVLGWDSRGDDDVEADDDDIAGRIPAPIVWSAAMSPFLLLLILAYGAKRIFFRRNKKKRKLA